MKFMCSHSVIIYMCIVKKEATLFCPNTTENTNILINKLVFNFLED